MTSRSHIACGASSITTGVFQHHHLKLDCSIPHVVWCCHCAIHNAMQAFELQVVNTGMQFAGTVYRPDTWLANALALAGATLPIADAVASCYVTVIFRLHRWPRQLLLPLHAPCAAVRAPGRPWSGTPARPAARKHTVCRHSQCPCNMCATTRLSISHILSTSPCCSTPSPLHLLLRHKQRQQLC